MRPQTSGAIRRHRAGRSAGRDMANARSQGWYWRRPNHSPHVTSTISILMCSTTAEATIKPHGSCHDAVADLSISVVSYPDSLNCCAHVSRRYRSSAPDRGWWPRSRWSTTPAVMRPVDLVRAEFPWVRVIENATNRGFGAAHNQALLGSAARYVLVLNSDTTVEPGCAGGAGGLPGRAPRGGGGRAAAAPSDGSVQPSRRRFPSVATLFLESTRCSGSGPTTPCCGGITLPIGRTIWSRRSTGSRVRVCVCARVVEDLGLFDERYFMYSEELDLCRRFGRPGGGWPYVPSAEVRHHEGAVRGSTWRRATSDFRLQAALRAQVAWRRRSARVARVSDRGVRGAGTGGGAQAGCRVAGGRAAGAVGGDRRGAASRAAWLISAFSSSAANIRRMWAAWATIRPGCERRLGTLGWVATCSVGAPWGAGMRARWYGWVGWRGGTTWSTCGTSQRSTCSGMCVRDAAAARAPSRTGSLIV